MARQAFLHAPDISTAAGGCLAYTAATLFFLLILLKPGSWADIKSMKRENLPWFLSSAALVAISQAFQLHLRATGVQPPTINATVTVLRFFFKVTLDRPETTGHLVFVYEPRKLPRVLSPEEVLRLLEAAPAQA
jgi:integrase